MSYFEELTQYCGFCFKKCGNVDALISIDEVKSLFDWSLHVNKLEQTNIRGYQTMNEKQFVIFLALL